MTSPDPRQNAATKWMLGILTVIALTWFLRLTYVVTMPLAAACFIAAVVWPVYRWLGRRAPRGLKWTGLVAAMSLVALTGAAFIAAVGTALTFVAARAPQYGAAVQKLWSGWSEQARARGVPVDQINAQGASDAIPQWIFGTLFYGLTSLWALAGFLILVFFFTALILLEARRWADKARTAFASEQAWRVVDTVRTISTKMRSYLMTQTMISLTSGIAEGCLVWALGVELAFVWGLLFFVLNFIPNVGSAIAIVPPTLIMLALHGPGWALVLLTGFITIETIIGYIVQPMWQGRHLAISPLVVLLSVVFWGWAWGAVGAVLAVPLTVSLMIAFAHVESLKPMALFLSDTSDEDELERHTTQA